MALYKYTSFPSFLSLLLTTTTNTSTTTNYYHCHGKNLLVLVLILTSSPRFTSSYFVFAGALVWAQSTKICNLALKHTHKAVRWLCSVLHCIYNLSFGNLVVSSFLRRRHQPHSAKHRKLKNAKYQPCGTKQRRYRIKHCNINAPIKANYFMLWFFSLMLLILS